MNVDEATALIAPAVRPGGTWADLGAGRGTFTMALARLLGEGGRVHAVDRDPAAVDALRRLAPRDGDATIAAIAARRADFTDAALARALPHTLDGVLLANALHYVPYDAQPAVLARVADLLGAGGRLVVVEYEHRAANRWVPYPVSLDMLGDVLPASLGTPARIGARRSAYGGTMYAAVATHA